MRRVGNASARCKGVGVFGSVLLRHEGVRGVLLRHKGVRGFRDALDVSWLGMEPEEYHNR